MNFSLADEDKKENEEKTGQIQKCTQL